MKTRFSKALLLVAGMTAAFLFSAVCYAEDSSALDAAFQQLIISRLTESQNDLAALQNTFDSDGHQLALVNKLTAVRNMLEAGNYKAAAHKIHYDGEWCRHFADWLLAGNRDAEAVWNNVHEVAMAADPSLFGLDWDLQTRYALLSVQPNICSCNGDPGDPSQDFVTVRTDGSGTETCATNFTQVIHGGEIVTGDLTGPSVASGYLGWYQYAKLKLSFQGECHKNCSFGICYSDAGRMWVTVTDNGQPILEKYESCGLFSDVDDIRKGPFYRTVFPDHTYLIDLLVDNDMLSSDVTWDWVNSTANSVTTSTQAGVGLRSFTLASDASYTFVQMVGVPKHCGVAPTELNDPIFRSFSNVSYSTSVSPSEYRATLVPSGSYDGTGDSISITVLGPDFPPRISTHKFPREYQY